MKKNNSFKIKNKQFVYLIGIALLVVLVFTRGSIAAEDDPYNINDCYDKKYNNVDSCDDMGSEEIKGDSIVTMKIYQISNPCKGFGEDSNGNKPNNAYLGGAIFKTVEQDYSEYCYIVECTCHPSEYPELDCANTLDYDICEIKQAGNNEQVLKYPLKEFEDTIYKSLNNQINLIVDPINLKNKLQVNYNHAAPNTKKVFECNPSDSKIQPYITGMCGEEITDKEAGDWEIIILHQPYYNTEGDLKEKCIYYSDNLQASNYQGIDDYLEEAGYNPETQCTETEEKQIYIAPVE